MVKEKIFFTADTHFGHKKIIEYEKRPFLTLDSMTDTLIKNWNHVVSNTDTIYVLGDFSFYNKEKTKDIVQRLNGRKVLILGNHDKGHSLAWWYDAGFNEVYKHPILLNYEGFIILSHEPIGYANAASPMYYMHGHVHNDPRYFTITNTSCCVCSERWNFTPVSLMQIVKAKLRYEASITAATKTFNENI